jgi:hypothetical protein
MNSFIISWDQTGVEAIVPVHEIEQRRTQAEQEKVWNVLADPEFRLPRNPPACEINHVMKHLIMRARANHQRHYEIYLINTASDITDADIRDMFEGSPQHSADLIRTRGTQLYSDRAKPDQIKIT